jgi:hypothetical protein
MDLERELLRRLVKGAHEEFLYVVDQAERYREAMAAGSRERFFQPLTVDEREERFRRLMALSEAAQRGEVARESVPLICRPIPDEWELEPPAGEAGRDRQDAGGDGLQ